MGSRTTLTSVVIIALLQPLWPSGHWLVLSGLSVSLRTENSCSRKNWSKSNWKHVALSSSVRVLSHPHSKRKRWGPSSREMWRNWFSIIYIPPLFLDKNNVAEMGVPPRVGPNTHSSRFLVCLRACAFTLRPLLLLSSFSKKVEQIKVVSTVTNANNSFLCPLKEFLFFFLSGTI